MTTKRRRMTTRVVKLVGKCQHAYANSWLYDTVAPASGDSFFVVLPTLNTATMQIFVDAFAQAFPDTFNVLVLDNSAGTQPSAYGYRSLSAWCFSPPIVRN
jgi:hypothetical protein